MDQEKIVLKELQVVAPKWEPRKNIVHSITKKKKKRGREWVDGSKSMKTCLYLVNFSPHSMQYCFLGSALLCVMVIHSFFRNCLICCWMDIPPLINPFSRGWTSGLFLEFYDYGQCRRLWRLLGCGGGVGGIGGRRLPITKGLIRAGKNPGLFKTFSGADVYSVTSPPLQGDSLARWRFLFHLC